MTASTLYSREKGCKRCPLRSGCTQVVPFQGPETARLMIVGEAPGAEEDIEGVPFCGASGRLLNKMLTTVGLTREDCFVTNVVRCRPPKNRTPTDEEIQACKPWMWKEVMMVRPTVLMTLGKTPSKLLLKGNSSFSITREVGKPHRAEYLPDDAIIVPVFHPSYLLRQGQKAIEDTVKIFGKVKKYLDEH